MNLVIGQLGDPVMESADCVTYSIAQSNYPITRLLDAVMLQWTCI
jgi:hypothetical protein